MRNIRVIKTGIDVSKILEQIKQYPEDWGSQKNIKDKKIKQLDPTKYTVTVDVLQLIMGGIEKEGQYVGDTEICIQTPAYEKHTEILKFLKTYFKKIRRCAFLSLPIGEIVGSHIDEGTYYLTRDRYHLSILGTYQYFCGTDTTIVEPGTLLWFNNKLEHGTKNVGDCVRITFVFDVSQSKR